MLASILDHSCTPNCAAIFNGSKVQVVAMERIPPGSIATSATISYISPMEDTQTRKRQQRRIWHFSCTCTLCSEEGKQVDRQKHSLVCRREGCFGGRPIILEEDEEMEKQEEQLEERVYTDVVEVGESEDFGDVEVVELVEVDKDDVNVQFEKNHIEIVEVDTSDRESMVEVTEEEILSSCCRVLPCWLCGEASEAGEQVRKEIS